MTALPAPATEPIDAKPRIAMFRRRSRPGSPWTLRWRDPATGRIRTRDVRGDRRAAIEAAARLETELALGGATGRRSLAWGRFVRDYLAALGQRARPRTVVEARSILGQFANATAAPRLGGITRHTVTDYLTEGRTTGWAEATYNKHLRTLRAAFQWAIDEGRFARRQGGRLVAENPCRGIRRLRERHKERAVYADPAQRDRCLEALAAAGTEWELAGRLGFYCGLRVAEMSHLCWRSVDLKRGFVTIQAEADGWGPKGHEAGTLALDARLVELLTAHAAASGAVPGARVLGGQKPDAWVAKFRDVLRKACTAVGLPVILPHGLRRSFGTILAAGGISAIDLRVVMRHADVRTSLKYYVRGDQEASAARARAILVTGIAPVAHPVPVDAASVRTIPAISVPPAKKSAREVPSPFEPREAGRPQVVIPGEDMGETTPLSVRLESDTESDWTGPESRPEGVS